MDSNLDGIKCSRRSLMCLVVFCLILCLFVAWNFRFSIIMLVSNTEEIQEDMGGESITIYCDCYWCRLLRKQGIEAIPFLIKNARKKGYPHSDYYLGLINKIYFDATGELPTKNGEGFIELHAPDDGKIEYSKWWGKAAIQQRTEKAEKIRRSNPER